MKEPSIETIDKYFPKGDERRGDALVVLATAFLDGRRTIKQEIINLLEKNNDN